MGSYEALVQQLHTGSLSEQHQAVAALLTLPLTTENWLPAVGSIPRLAQLLNAASTTVPRAAAVRYLLHHISNPGQCLEMRNVKPAPDGVILPLVSLLRHDDTDMRHVAALTLSNLAKNGDNQSNIMEAGAIAPLVQLLKSKTERLHFPAAQALAFLAENFDVRTRIIAAGAVRPLLQLFSSSILAVQLTAAMAIRILVGNNASLVAADGAIPLLIKLLQSSSTDVQWEAVEALRNISSDISVNAQLVSAAGALPILKRLLQTSRSPEVQQEAAETLENLAQSEITAADVVEPLVNSLQPWPDSMQSAAARASANISCNNPDALPPPRKSCWTCGVMGVPLQKCSVCAVAAYCGVGCQKADWKAHKGQCAGLKAGATGGGSSAVGEGVVL